ARLVRLAENCWPTVPSPEFSEMIGQKRLKDSSNPSILPDKLPLPIIIYHGTIALSQHKSRALAKEFSVSPRYPLLESNSPDTPEQPEGFSAIFFNKEFHK